MFSPKVREKLKFYVYLYLDPETDKPFYVGKGRGNRCFAHLNGVVDNETAEVIRKLKKNGLKPHIEILKYGLTEEQALLVEATAIDLLGVTSLTNQVRGHGSRYGGRGSVDEIAAHLDAKPVKITEPAMLVTISRAYRYGMTTQELYDVTRSAWKVAPQRHDAKFALSVYRGIVREVFEIVTWIPGGSTMRGVDKSGRSTERPDRWEFVGRVADEHICRKYVGKSVAHYFSKGARNPIMYANC
ncbi:MAG: hypothetical protein V3W34_02080 [Phycisphaerae bacterium]